MPLTGIAAQEGLGDFGSGDSGGGFGFQGPAGLAVKIGGEVRAQLLGFYDEMRTADKAGNISPGDIFTGCLNFDAAGSAAEGVVNLKLTPVFDGSSPIALDEAYVRAFFGPVTVEGGLRKLSWGRADSFSPLDVINPLDYTDLTKLADDLQYIKLARPMVHGTWSLGSFTKLEAVFVPTFQGDKFATTGRWAPSQINDLRATITQTLASSPSVISKMVAGGYMSSTDAAQYLNQIPGIGVSLNDSINSGSIYPETDTLKYAQGGARFTTTLGSSDVGIQYYFGRFTRPAISGLNPYGFVDAAGLHPEALTPDINYNYYHQIAADFARVIAGFNFRAEAGANITKDLDGKNGTVENPALVWSLGFDRDLFAGINLNLQGTGKVRLFYKRIGSDPLTDCEAGSKISSTRITGKLSKKFFQDKLELKATALWGIEDKDFLVMPAVSWSQNDVSAEISAGFFGGDKNGELGQYRDNGYCRLLLGYKF